MLTFHDYLPLNFLDVVLASKILAAKVLLNVPLLIGPPSAIARNHAAED